MCTRYLLLQQHARAMLEQLGLDADPSFVSRYNLAPGSALPVVRAKPRENRRDGLAPLLQPPPGESLTALAVSSHVSNVRHEGPACIAPAGDETPGDGPQLSLGI